MKCILMPSRKEVLNMKTEKTVIRLWTREIDAEQMSVEELYEDLSTTFDILYIPDYFVKKS